MAGFLSSCASSLRSSAESGDIAMARELISQGVDVNERSGIFSWTPLHIAARNGDLAMVKFLVKNGASINIRERFAKLTPLHYAALGGYLDVIRFLVESGANVMSFSSGFSLSSSETPKDMAFRKGHVKAGELLASYEK